MSPPLPNEATIHVSLDELIALSAAAHGVRLARNRRSAAMRSGAGVSRWRGRGVDFRESRPYQPGDEIRHMDWRVTARSGKPHTKLFEEEREQSLLIALDCNAGMRFGTRVRFKSVQAARVAALLAWLASMAGDRVGALGFGGDIHGEVKPAGGRRGVLRLLRSVRDWDAAATDAVGHLSQALSRARRLLRPGMRLFIITDGYSVDDAALRMLPQIAHRHEMAVILLDDPLELAPPPPGRYAMRTGDVARIVDFGSAHVRRTWTTRFRSARESLLAECRGLGIRVLEVDTRADLRLVLAPLLERGFRSQQGSA